MWIELSKLVLCLYFCSTAASYHTKLHFIKSSDNAGRNAVSGPSDNHKTGGSRYPHLEKLKTRIEKMDVDGEPSESKESFYKIRHKGWANYRPATTTVATTTTTESDLFDTYGGFEDDVYDDLFEDDEDDLDYDDYSPMFNDVEDVQAEEPTERPTIAPKPISSFAQEKWNRYGTAADVAESRRTYLSSSNNNPKYQGFNADRSITRDSYFTVQSTPSSAYRKVKAAVEHSIRVNQQGRCSNPSPKVIPVQREHPDSTKIYTPHCTVLHRCGEDTGCCRYDDTCQYKHREVVQLYFYTKILGSMETKVEKLSFYNHTECECRQKTSDPTVQEEDGDDWSSLTFKSSDTSVETIARCKCPKHFIETTSSFNTCTCDCDEKNKNCIPLKKGNEHLSMADRICIATDNCTMPNCEYGNYSRDKGKCPSLEDRMTKYRNIVIP